MQPFCLIIHFIILTYYLTYYSLICNFLFFKCFCFVNTNTSFKATIELHFIVSGLWPSGGKERGLKLIEKKADYISAVSFGTKPKKKTKNSMNSINTMNNKINSLRKHKPSRQKYPTTIQEYV